MHYLKIFVTLYMCIYIMAVREKRSLRTVYLFLEENNNIHFEKSQKI